MAPHTPHDDVYDIVVSPDFANDGTVFVACRDMFLRSDDGGMTWKNIVNGLNNMFQYFSDTEQRFSLDISRQDKRILYFSSRGDTVYRSTDGGWSWTTVDVGPRRSEITALAISPHSSDIVVAACAPQGLLMTVDGGSTWQPVDAIDTAVTALAFAPEREGVVLVGDAHGTLHVSTDGGSSWRRTSLGDVGRIRSIAVSPDFTNDHTIAVGSERGGVHLSTDEGVSFSSRNVGLEDLSISSVVFSSKYAHDATLWTSTWFAGVFASHDRGTSWKKYSVGLTMHPQKLEERYDERPHFGCLRLAGSADRHDQQEFFLAGFDGLFHSTDGGRGWHELPTLPSTLRISIAVSPDYANDGSVAMSTYINGAFLSNDRGDTFTPVNKGLQERRYMHQAPDTFARLFGIGFSPNYAQDDTLFCAGWTYFLRSTTRGKEWTRFDLGEKLPLQQLVMAISPDFTRDQTIFLGNRFGDIHRTTTGGTEWSVAGNIGGHVRAIGISPEFASDDTMFAAGLTPEHCHVSHDRGVTWAPAGSGLPRLAHLAVSPCYGTDRTVFAGTRRGLFVTTDGAEHWEPIANAAYGPGANVEALAVSPDFASDGTVLLTVSGKGLFKSTDGAATFAPIAGELLANNQIFANIPNAVAKPIVFSPSYATDQTIFGYSPTHAFRSTDGGETWTDISPPKTLHKMPPPRVVEGGAPTSKTIQERLDEDLLAPAPAPPTRLRDRLPFGSSSKRRARR